MKRPTMEKRATLAPARCIITGGGDGPIIDTKTDFSEGKPRDRIYLSVGAVAHLLRDLGWIDPSDAEKLRAENHDLTVKVGRLTAENDRLEHLKAAIEEFVPEPTVERVEVERTVPVPPTDEQIKDFIDRNPEFGRYPQNATEEWYRYYGKKGPSTAKERAAERRKQQIREANAQQADEKQEAAFGEPPSSWPLHGQTVDLDELLSQGVRDVTAFVDGHPADFQRAVLAREVWLRNEAGKDPRKTIVDAIVAAVGEPEEVQA